MNFIFSFFTLNVHQFSIANIDAEFVYTFIKFTPFLLLLFNIHSECIVRSIYHRVRVCAASCIFRNLMTVIITPVVVFTSSGVTNAQYFPCSFYTKNIYSFLKTLFLLTRFHPIWPTCFITSDLMEVIYEDVTIFYIELYICT
jgi:hypothetical protein